MNSVFVRRAGFTCLGLMAGVFVMALTTWASTSSPAVLEACVNPGNGMMRLVESSTPCHANETRVSWNSEGPVGPAGPTGPTGPTGAQGPPGSASGGPPFVWVCTPANYDLANNGFAEIDIFNGSATTANVAAHFLSRDGTNLAGSPIPGTSPTVNYPGQTGSATVTLASDNTMIIPYQIGAGLRSANAGTLLASVRVISDQPIVVGSQMPQGPQQAVPCNLLAQ